MQVGDLVVRNPACWDGGLDEIGIIIDYHWSDPELVLVHWLEPSFRRHYSVYDLEVINEI